MDISCKGDEEEDWTRLGSPESRRLGGHERCNYGNANMKIKTGNRGWIRRPLPIVKEHSVPEKILELEKECSARAAFARREEELLFKPV